MVLHAASVINVIPAEANNDHHIHSHPRLTSEEDDLRRQGPLHTMGIFKRNEFIICMHGNELIVSNRVNLFQFMQEF